jgi:hypothetical protein
MKKIPLSQFGKNRGKYFALVDDEDFEYLNQWRWFAFKGKQTHYVHRNSMSGPNKKTIPMHRVIMKTPDNLIVDHKDHDGLNNQKSNPRNCTKYENHQNRRPSGRSKYLGVNYDRMGGIRAQIRVNKKLIHIGTFKTEEEAARARDIYSKKYFGEFANLNFK